MLRPLLMTILIVAAVSMGEAPVFIRLIGIAEIQTVCGLEHVPFLAATQSVREATGYSLQHWLFQFSSMGNATSFCTGPIGAFSPLFNADGSLSTGFRGGPILVCCELSFYTSPFTVTEGPVQHFSAEMLYCNLVCFPGNMSGTVIGDST